MSAVARQRSAGVQRAGVIAERDLVPVREGLGALWVATDDGVTRNGVAASALRSRAGIVTLVQGTGASQPAIIDTNSGRALRFDGANDQLSCAVADAVQPTAHGLSVVFVAQGRAGSAGDFPPVVSCRPWVAATDAGYAIACNGSGSGGVLTAHFASGAGGSPFDHDASSGATRGLSLTRRELWCVVFDHVAQRLRWYRNGVLDVERSPSWPSTVPVSATDLRIGMDRAVGVGTRRLAADVYAVSVHRIALRPQDVTRYWSAWGALFAVPS